MAVVTDPVCGMQFESGQADAQTNYKGTAYFFCSNDCRQTFEANPEEFIGNDTETTPPEEQVIPL